jgi:hypothetical protein
VIAAVNPVPQSDVTEYAAEHEPVCAPAGGVPTAAKPRMPTAIADATTNTLRDLLRGSVMTMHLHGFG